VDPELVVQARKALVAWQEGDVATLEPLLAPQVELLWWEPGGWDCHRHEAALALLRERARRGTGEARVDLIEVGDALVVARRWMVGECPEPGVQPATLVTFREGKVVRMRQFLSREKALAAATAEEVR
jgi:ketosteroid isomerase-like protein